MDSKQFQIQPVTDQKNNWIIPIIGAGIAGIVLIGFFIYKKNKKA